MRKLNGTTDVVILCGGMGTRLREETDIKPKPMVEIGGKPILWHIMKHYSQHGLSRFVLALGYKGDLVKEYFSRPQDEKWEVVCVDTGPDTLKGGRVKRLEPHIKSNRFHLTYGDGVSDIDLSGLESFHRKTGKTGTVSAVRPPSRFGELLIDGDMVKEFEEKPQLTTGHINGGYFIFEKRFLDYLTTDEKCDLEFGALQKLAREGELSAYKHEGYWQCMDNVRDMEYLNKLWQGDNPPWKTWK